MTPRPSSLKPQKNREKFACEILSHKEVQRWAPGKADQEEGFRVDVTDAPRELLKVLSDVASGNPKFIIEQLDPLISGYAEGEYVSHGRARGKASGPMLPAIKIATHHELSVNTKSLSDYPWPKKIVGFVEQSYQDLNEKLQVRCYHARSSFDLLVKIRL